MNLKVKQRKQKGFSIIEVVLVLAIAGLIFLMVFIALPALQRSQRDTARKNDVGALASDIQSYVSNNAGQHPPANSKYKTDDDGNWECDPDCTAGTPNDAFVKYITNLSNNTTNISIQAAKTLTATPSSDSGELVVTFGTACSSSSTLSATGALTLTTASTSSYTVVTKLESGGDSSGYCSSN